MSQPARLSEEQRRRLTAVASKTEGQPQIEITRASEIAQAETRWLWDGRVPLGAVTLLAGREGLGKSTLACRWAADASCGRLGGHLAGEPHMTLLASGEDDAASTLVPRLRAADADMSRVAFVGQLELPSQLDQLRERAREVSAKLLVLDPILAFLGSKIDSHHVQHVRIVMSRLWRMAQELDMAVVPILHLKKTGEQSAILDRIAGAGFTQAARSVLLYGTDPDDQNGRVLAHVKCNLGPRAPSLRSSISMATVNGSGPEVITSRILFHGRSEVSARDLVDTDQQRSEYREAMEFLRVELHGCARATKDILRSARQLGISDRTLYRAKADLGVRSQQSAIVQGWEWELPTGGMA